MSFLTDLQQAPLGHAVTYPAGYDAGLLFSIPRQEQRDTLPGRPPFFGADLWTAYELSWLNTRGKPQVAIARFTIPCDSHCIVESKSFKLYLSSFNAARFADAAEVRACLQRDLADAISKGADRRWTPGVQIILPDAFAAERIEEPAGIDLDRLDIECVDFTPKPELLRSDAAEVPVTEVLRSNLLKSNCPVTGQPDWGSVQVSYSGAPIDQAGLLAYLVSYRDHAGFHEHCVERIFADLWERCRPTRLSVLARYTRRGGLDINPYRTSSPAALPLGSRTARQ